MAQRLELVVWGGVCSFREVPGGEEQVCARASGLPLGQSHKLVSCQRHGVDPLCLPHGLVKKSREAVCIERALQSSGQALAWHVQSHTVSPQCYKAKQQQEN